MISLNKINEFYKKIKINLFLWIGVNPPKTNDTIIEELTNMSKTEKDILTDIVINNHEEEFRIIETGDDAGSHFAVYIPRGSNAKKIRTEILEKKIKKTVIIIETPPGYIGSIMR